MAIQCFFAVLRSTRRLAGLGGPGISPFGNRRPSHRGVVCLRVGFFMLFCEGLLLHKRGKACIISLDNYT